MNFGCVRLLILWGILLCGANIFSMEYFDPAPASSLVQLLWDNRNSLQGIAPDEGLIKELIAWIENNAVDVNEVTLPTSAGESLLDLVARAPHGVGIDKRILYALLRNPKFIQYQPQGPFSTLYCYSFDHLLPERLSYLLLFLPFGLAQSYTMEPSPGLTVFVDEFWRRIETVFPKMADERRELQDSKNVVAYLAETKNLTLIKVIFFLATGTVTKNITGNEKTDDGITVLMFAVGGGYLELVKKLLAAGADPLVVNTYGDDALAIAELQLQRATFDQDWQQRKIYEQIHQLLERHVTQKAQDIIQNLDEDMPVSQEFTFFDRLHGYLPAWVVLLLSYVPSRKR